MTITRVPVAVPGAVYDVWIGDGLLEQVGKRLRDVTPARKAALITDYDVADLYAADVDSNLARSGFEVVPMKVPSGEGSKTWNQAGDILEAMAAHRLGREDIVVALGGGVIGDLAGFAAAVYLRGVQFAQIPTTLLAMVDSSVGGKTGVDLSAGKNLAGAFKQPIAVLADTSVLATLPNDQWRSGIAEAVKSAVIDGEGFLGWLEGAVADLGTREPDAVIELIRRCVEFKSAVVARDETEEGPRECLNYGHTLGHALEKALGYGTISHGAAVAEGMRFASRVAVDVVGSPPELAKRQDRLLDAVGLPAMQSAPRPAVLLDAMRSDKKSRGGSVRMVLPSAPGTWTCEAVSDTVVMAHLNTWASTKKGE